MSGSRWARVESVLASPRLLWLLVIVGVIVRVRQYGANRSLWLDESFFALTILGRGMHRLLTTPLDFNQAGPTGFLFVEKLATELFGKSEFALRAFPLVCGVVAVPLFAVLARRVLDPVAAAIAVAFLTVCGPLIYFSSELKPYAGDVAATIALTLIGLQMVDRPLSLRRSFAFGVIGFILIQLTYAGLLAAAGIGAAVLGIALRDRRWERSRNAIWAVSLWAVGAAVFLVSYQGTTRSFVGHDGTLGNFAPLPFSKTAVTWYFRKVTYVFADANLYQSLSNPLVLLTLLAAGLVLMGAVELLRRNWRWSAILFAPMVATLAASGLHKYPMLSRTLLFFVPVVFLLIANGVIAVVRSLPDVIGPIVAGIAVTFLLAHASFAANYSVVRTVWHAEIKQALPYAAQHWRQGDVLYLHYSSQYAFSYYAECGCFRLSGDRAPQSIWPVRRVSVRNTSRQFPRVLVPEGAEVIVGRSVKRPDQYASDIPQIIRHRRAWILVTFYSSTKEIGEIDRGLLGRLDEHGRRLTSITRGGAHLYLYEFPQR